MESVEEFGDGGVIIGKGKVGGVDVDGGKVRIVLLDLALELGERGAVGDFIASWG